MDIKNYVPLNWQLIENPLNWIIVALMIIIPLYAGELLLTSYESGSQQNGNS